MSKTAPRKREGVRADFGKLIRKPQRLSEIEGDLKMGEEKVPGGGNKEPVDEVIEKFEYLDGEGSLSPPQLDGKKNTHGESLRPKGRTRY